MVGKVFLGGYGQSGVSTLNGMLAGHPDILSCPFESCFVVAPTGLLDLLMAVSQRYDPMRVDVAAHSFEQLMLRQMSARHSYPYEGFDLRRFFGRERYEAAVRGLFHDLGIISYRGDALTMDSFLRIGDWRPPTRFRRARLPKALARQRGSLFWARRLLLSNAMSAGERFLDQLYGSLAISERKSAWVDQTTNNALYIDALHQLCPDARYIHVVRDPVDVAGAYMAARWASHDLTEVCSIIRAIHFQMTELRAAVPAHLVLDVHFERLIASPEHELRRVCRFLGLEFSASMLAAAPPAEDVARLSRMRRKMLDRAVVGSLLDDVAESMGYTVPA